MNIWIEYYKIDNAQMNEKFVPDPKKILRRFCQNHADAQALASRLIEQGYLVSINQDRSK